MSESSAPSSPTNEPQDQNRGRSGGPSSLGQLQIRAREALDDLSSRRWRLGGVVVLALVCVGIWGLTQVGSGSAAAASNFAPTSSGAPTHANTATGSGARSSASTATSDDYTSTSMATQELVVDAVGGVKTPGVYKVAAAARVGDVVTAAGGLTDDADLDRINLAAKITDGERIYVVRKGEAAPGADASTSGASTADGTAEVAPVNINDASATDLDALPGVGPATAAAIVQYRTQHGPFRAVADLSKVSGIGPSKLAQIKPHATV